MHREKVIRVGKQLHHVATSHSYSNYRKVAYHDRDQFPNCNGISYNLIVMPNSWKKTWILAKLAPPCILAETRPSFSPRLFDGSSLQCPRRSWSMLSWCIPYNPKGLRNTSEHLSEELHGIKDGPAGHQCMMACLIIVSESMAYKNRIVWHHMHQLVDVFCTVHFCQCSISCKQFCLTRYTDSLPVVTLRRCTNLWFCNCFMASFTSRSAHSTTSTLLGRGISASSWHQ